MTVGDERESAGLLSTPALGLDLSGSTHHVPVFDLFLRI